MQPRETVPNGQLTYQSRKKMVGMVQRILGLREILITFLKNPIGLGNLENQATAKDRIPKTVGLI